MFNFILNRRTVLTTGVASAMVATLKQKAQADGLKSSPDFNFEVMRSEEEWRAMLSEEEYGILREGGTEKQKASPLWNETRKGVYHCKGCDLPIYDSDWKEVLEKGWCFFRHAQPSAIMTGIDGFGTRYYDGEDFARLSTMEVHCRRCGSHLGHIFIVQGMLLHCINGTSLVFKPAEA